MKRYDTKKLALCSMLVAIAVTINFISSLFPKMSLTIVAVASLGTAIALFECGYGHAALVYVAASVLSFLIVPDKQCAIFYALFFGHYPITKFFVERAGRPLIVWAAKLLCANVLIVAVYFLLTRLFTAYEDTVGVGVITGLVISNFAFVLYDICITRLVMMYISRRLRRR